MIKKVLTPFSVPYVASQFLRATAQLQKKLPMQQTNTYIPGGRMLGKQREERELRDRSAREQREQALLERVSRETEEASRKAAEDARKRDAVAEYR